MHYAPKPMVLAVSFALAFMTQAALAETAPKLLPEAVVQASKLPRIEAPSTSLDSTQITAKRAASSDTTSLLKDTPGISINGAGGLSSLPAIHGMADDRIRIQVDGMDLISACANHMNSPLSYIDTSKVASVKVFAGIAPVSAGGDSIAGTIQVNSAAPEFAKNGEDLLIKGEVGAFYRSNANAHGANLAASIANQSLSLKYSASSTEAGNFTAAKDFKPAAQSMGTASFIQADEVASSSYKSEHQALAFAIRHQQHLLELQLGLQKMPYQGFPNQRMDMTGNDSRQINLHYTGQYLWGSLDARIYKENTQHKMNFLADKMGIGSKGMPMETEGKTSGAKIKA
ncbi:MAG: TonB-dependent receptor plug domain-containing protein, partial [Burkholderiales bacterium]|nr:TonB-dependent receptor plug domain-containing protein [Burkholderiales bacterium]